MSDSTEELYLCRLSITVSASKLNVELLNGFQKLICDKSTDEQGQDMQEFLLSFYHGKQQKFVLLLFSQTWMPQGLVSVTVNANAE